MNTAEMSDLADRATFTPFVIVTVSDARFTIPHPDFIDIPPLPEEEGAEPSYVTVYNRAAVARFIALSNIDSIEFQPGQTA